MKDTGTLRTRIRDASHRKGAARPPTGPGNAPSNESTWPAPLGAMNLRRVVAPLPRLSWRLRNGFWDFERESNARCGQALHRRFLFV
jgi:hypothetical protein